MDTNQFLIELQAKLNEEASKGNINADLDTISKAIEKLKVQAEIDPNSVKNIAEQLSKILNQKIVVDNIQIDAGQAVKNAQQAGKQVADAVNRSVDATSKSTSKVLRDFSELNDVKRQFVNKNNLISKDDIADAEKFFDTVREAFAEFGQVTVSKGSMNDGLLENMRVKIEQVNGEMKITRDFMLFFNENKNKNGFTLAGDDTIRTTEKMVQHLNKKYYGKLEQATKEQLAIEKQRITAGEKQLEILDAQRKRCDSRISYNENQIDKKGLSDISKQEKLNDLEYSGREKIDASFAKELDKNLSSLSKLKEIWKEQGIYVDEFRGKVERLEKSLDNITIGDVKELNAIKDQLSSLSSEADGIYKAKKIQFDIDTGDYDANVNALISKTKLFTDENGRAAISTTELKKALKELTDASNTYAGNRTEETQKRLIAAAAKLDTEYKKISNTYKTMNAELIKDTQRLNQVNSMRQWADNNTKALKKYGVEINRIIDEMGDLSKTMSKADFTKLVNEFKKVQAEARQTGNIGMTAFDKIKNAWAKFGGWGMATGSLMTVWNQMQRIPEEVVKVNSAMVELNKVSNASASDIKKYFDEAAESAKDLGASISDVINATADWSRLGYNLSDSKKLAEVAVLYTHVGDNIDINKANESLISTLRGFQLEADDALSIIDRFNEVITLAS